MKPAPLIFILLLLMQSAITSAEDYQPRVWPEGWVVANYSENLRLYLKAQHKNAKDQGRTPYIYVYSDQSEYCRSIRALMRRKDMRDAFSNNLMVMISHRKLMDALNRPRNFAENFTPLIMLISEQGDLVGQPLHPAIYYFHPGSSGVPELENYSILRKWTGPLAKHKFATVLKRYFEEQETS